MTADLCDSRARIASVVDSLGLSIETFLLIGI